MRLSTTRHMRESACLAIPAAPATAPVRDETAPPRYQPQVQLVLQRTHIGNQLVLKSLRIVHQVSRMYLEKRASSMRVEFVRCGRAPLSICER